MFALGRYLLRSESTAQKAEGQKLVDEGTRFEADLRESVRLCTVSSASVSSHAVASGGGESASSTSTSAPTAHAFLPPYATVGAIPYTNMTDGTIESYANFRFYSETLLADMLPRSIEASFLELHNHKGGRFAGANRFLGWLDDMPTAGWGYGALTNNQTDNFLALLYGHMATYQSRGTFHTTEQLSYRGEGHYRAFNHWKDPAPRVVLESSATPRGVGENWVGEGGVGELGSVETMTSTGRWRSAKQARLGYYFNEVIVACIHLCSYFVTPVSSRIPYT
jgi:hypothetical protein